MLDTIKALCALSGISGREDVVREYIISQIEGYAEYSTDPLGNLIVFKKGAQPAKKKVLVDAHMDEVGMIVTYITDDGYLKFAKVGGIDTRVMLGKNVFVGKNAVSGVVGIKPIHLTDSDKENDIPDVDELYIDIGADSAEQAQKYVSLGDSVWFDSDFTEFGEGMVKARALDDRVGCAIMIEMIKSEQPFDLWFSFTVQEEIGTRGAVTGTFNVKPDYAVAVETTTAADILGVDGEKRVCQLGKGAVVSFMDRGTIYPKALYDKAFEIAEKKGIKAQTKTMVAGGNDAAAIHKSGSGVRVITVSVPCRYLHSPSCVIKYDDAVESFKLVNSLVAELADDTLD